MADNNGDEYVANNITNVNSDAPTFSYHPKNLIERVHDFDVTYKKLVQNQKLIMEFMEKMEQMGEQREIQDNTITENKEKVLEEFQSIRDRMKECKRILENTCSINSVNIVDGETKPKNNSQQSIPMKNFVMTHTFKGVTNWKGKKLISEILECFGIRWRFIISHRADHLEYGIYCMEPLKPGKKIIEVEYELKIKSKTGDLKKEKSSCTFDGGVQYVMEEFIEWNDIKNNYLIDGDLTIELHIKYKKMIGIYKKNLREFDETMEDFSDVVLIVNEQRFHVLSKFLAAQSSYFNVMFLGRFDESSQSEIKLSGIDADDFQNYLEVLYGHPAIDDYTVEGILMIADMYDTQTVIMKCQKFLMKESKKTSEKKWELANTHDLEALKRKLPFQGNESGGFQYCEF